MAVVSSHSFGIINQLKDTNLDARTNNVSDPIAYEKSFLIESQPEDLIMAVEDNQSKSYRAMNALRRVIHKLKHGKKQPLSQLDDTHTYSSGSKSLKPALAMRSLKTTSQQSPHQYSLREKSIATIRSSSMRRERQVSKIELIDETWEDWLENYRKGNKDLSHISRPTSFSGFGHMTPPMHIKEANRLKAVDKVNNLALWAPELKWLNSELSQLLKDFKMKTACISIIDRTTQQNMFELGLGHELAVFGRDLSLDAHTILSKAHFALLDASIDWRTRLNPLVHGPPFIKFYLGVPLFIDNYPVGCISLCDPYLKVHLSSKMIERLTNLSATLSRKLELRLKAKKSGRGLSSIQWDDNELDENDDLLEFDFDCADLGAHKPFSVPSILGCSSSEEDPIDNEAKMVKQQQQHSPCCLPLPVYNTSLQPLSCQSLIQPFQVFESLLKCETVPQVIKKACKLVKQNLGVDLIYIVEIRMASDLQSSAIRNNLLKLNKEESGLMNISDSIQNVHVKPVSHCTTRANVNIENIVNKDIPLLSAAITSEFGIQYLAEGSNGLEDYESGFVIPFRRRFSTEFNTFTGGFAMAVFDMKLRFISPGDKAFTKKVVSALENILTCHEELNDITGSSKWNE